MEFCTITPIAGLERYGTALSRRHLVLAHMLHNKEYYNYYEGRRRAGDFLILDNGAYENTKPLDSAAYFNWILDLNPQVAVLPDILMSPWRKTTSAALRFLDEYGDSPRLKDYRTEWMFVPQIASPPGKEIDDWIRSAVCVLNDGRQGHKVTWIGLGRYLATEYGLRKYMAEWVSKNFPGVKLHALGMSSGSIEEMKELIPFVDSIDSSAPVWRGWVGGYDLQTPFHIEQWKEKGTPCDFHAEYRSTQDEYIQHNLEVIKNALS